VLNLKNVYNPIPVQQNTYINSCSNGTKAHAESYCKFVKTYLLEI